MHESQEIIGGDWVELGTSRSWFCRYSNQLSQKRDAKLNRLVRVQSPFTARQFNCGLGCRTTRVGDVCRPNVAL